MTKNKPDPLDPLIVQQFLGLIKEQHERDMDRINEKLDDKFEALADKIDKSSEDNKNHIETVEGKSNAKLDGIDEALRGNGRIGVYEQMRKIKSQIMIIFICLSLLFGLKIWNTSLDEWMKEFWTSQRKSHVVPATQPTTNPTTTHFSGDKPAVGVR